MFVFEREKYNVGDFLFPLKKGIFTIVATPLRLNPFLVARLIRKYLFLFYLLLSRLTDAG